MDDFLNFNNSLNFNRKSNFVFLSSKLKKIKCTSEERGFYSFEARKCAVLLRTELTDSTEFQEYVKDKGEKGHFVLGIF